MTDTNQILAEAHDLAAVLDREGWHRRAETVQELRAALATRPEPDVRTAAADLLYAIEDDEEGMDLGGYDHLAEELAALRAALATRPEPLFEGTMADFIRRFDSLDPSPPATFDPIVVYPAAAGSATPTPEDQHPYGRPGSPGNPLRTTHGAAAGSATPTVHQYVPTTHPAPCGACGKAAESSVHWVVAAAGSAIPED
jgi:hypothetical protein